MFLGQGNHTELDYEVIGDALDTAEIDHEAVGNAKEAHDFNRLVAIDLKSIDHETIDVEQDVNDVHLGKEGEAATFLK